MSDRPSVDPVRQRRARIARLVAVGQRVGYALFGIAIVAFVVGFVSGFDGAVGTIVVASIVIGSIVLAPAIVFGYAVKAAERDDRERGL
ncbi:MAG TPA: hypothetical protein VFV32_09805 [Acidimicrobiales bacterium]|jgi:hypothetical protein|nr:hypothetical protein [Acidimicrobiales bacterium]